MSPILQCSCCKKRAAIVITGKKGTPGVRICAFCDAHSLWPIHKKWKGKA